MKLVEKPEYVPVIKQNNPALLEPHEFEAEIDSLKIKIMRKDTSFSNRELLIKLFNLYIHFNNPRPDYEKAYLLADSLISDKKLTKKILTYYNWKYILKQHLDAVKKNDEHINSLISIKSRNKSLEYENKMQNRRIDSLTSVIKDSLMSVIRKQNEAIEKLKEVDLRLERHRAILK
ncbi:MAG: hypothetical protein PVI26_09730 [Chitinispirillia bacterium]